MTERKRPRKKQRSKASHLQLFDAGILSTFLHQLCNLPLLRESLLLSEVHPLDIVEVAANAREVVADVGVDDADAVATSNV